MKKANKALAALLALTMVTGSLAGCGSSNGSGKTETAPATESTTETADAGASGVADGKRVFYGAYADAGAERRLCGVSVYVL